MNVQLQKDLSINFYKKNLGKIDSSTSQSEDLFLYYRGWIESIMLKTNTVLDRMPKEGKGYYLKHERLPKEFQNTPFGEAYVKLEKLIDRMLGFEYSKDSHSECVRFFTSCEKYVDDVLAWLEANEPKQ